LKSEFVVDEFVPNRGKDDVRIFKLTF